MEWTRLLLVFVDIVLPLFTGYMLKARHIFSHKACSNLIRFNVIFMCTLVNSVSFWGLKLSAALLWLPVASVLLTLVPGFIGARFFSHAFTDDLDRGAYVISSMLANIGTISGLSAFILYGETGFAYVQLVAAPQNCLMVAAAFPMARYYALLGMFAGVALQAADVPRPEILGTFFHYLVHILAWVSLLPVGYLIDFRNAGRYYGRVKNMLLQRYILIPVIFYFPFRALFHDPALFGSAMLVTFSPAAINSVITAELYKLNVDLTISGFLLTTAVYIFLVFPLLFLCVNLAGR